MSATYCPKCPCPNCEKVRDFIKDDGRPVVIPAIQNTGFPGPECAYERIAREYAERGQQMPTSMLLYCGCRKCSPTC